MAEFIAYLIAGLATGAIYALAAIGFTLVWQTSQTINFAQGEFVMLPAILILALVKLAGAPFWLAAVLGIGLFIALFGWGFKIAIVDPMIRHGVLPLAIATMALAIIMKEGAKDGFSAEAQSFPSLLPAQTLSFMGISISLQHIAIIIVASVAIGGLQWFVTRTRTGRQMQAAAQNPGVALILGIPVARMVMLTFLINAGLAALASVLISPIYLAKFSNGEVIGLFAFIAAIVGGFNQVRGALAGGLIVGVLDSLAAAYISTSYRLAVPLVLLVIIILVKPEGLFGRKEERRV
ncbi:MAG: branched-chain amino acid ABC transporter permease [Methylobacterium sp.]|nr:branched-chain amino acid ABC transporter permease [Methylobacterium sp.]MCA3597580.1 branched-chain amino acid ABC transporter permease [Methylobacterium sp.]MCA3601212.1 branched-chain amino acid ABC transporter permease [Methylobacterium sp.]MCA3603056.1 branched-chain amino acid ABC transporter permease [Methylobacterium sp.]MCA3605808.1 branched-chain amino acid ABC transporter permease [Methylobacterium sp.]